MTSLADGLVGVRVDDSLIHRGRSDIVLSQATGTNLVLAESGCTLAGLDPVLSFGSVWVVRVVLVVGGDASIGIREVRLGRCVRVVRHLVDDLVERGSHNVVCVEV